jgi:hypothetical protein
MFSILLAAALATEAEAVSQEPNLAAAKSWVSLVDAKRWDDSWALLELCSDLRCRKRVGPRPLLRFESRWAQFRREL